ncbi:MAG: Cytosol aminopeptidase family, N-terminal domain, partial [Thermoleophilaceae bacterium]|nr:Cytosol aminopeptidase family, N-terminal domain [Thermoleophilaceae bacterium]
MNVTVTQEPTADTRVVPVFENQTLDGALQALVDSGEAKPAAKKTAVFHDGDARVILVGAGRHDDADAERLRVAAAAAATRAKELGAKAL